MDGKVAFLMHELQSRFPDASVADTLAAVNTLLTEPAIPGTVAQSPSTLSSPAHIDAAGRDHANNDGTNTPNNGHTDAVKDRRWRTCVSDILDMAARQSAKGGDGRSSRSTPVEGVNPCVLAVCLNNAITQWVQQQQPRIHSGRVNGQGAAGASGGSSSEIHSARSQSSRGSYGKGTPTSRTGDAVGASHGSGRAPLRAGAAVPPARGQSFAAAVSASGPMPVGNRYSSHTNANTNGGSLDATPSVVSIDATPEDLPMGSPTSCSASIRFEAAVEDGRDDGGGGGDDAFSGNAASTGLSKPYISMPMQTAAAAPGARHIIVTSGRGDGNERGVVNSPLTETVTSGTSLADQEHVATTAEESLRLAEELCRSVYEDLYQQVVVANRNDEEEEDHQGNSGRATRGLEDDHEDDDDTSGSGGENDLPAPLCSLVIECDGSGSGVEPASHMRSSTGTNRSTGDIAPVFSFVVGCSWSQWSYLLRGPLACQCPPYPPSDAPREEKMRWRQRHCQIRLLHPVSDFLQHRALGAAPSHGDGTGTSTTNRRPYGGGPREALGHGSNGNAHNTTGGTDNTDGASDITTTNVEYDLSEGHVVLRSLLGLAMRVWGEVDAHVVAQISDLEATHPTRTYHSAVFWSTFPQHVPPPLRRGDRASLRGCQLPTPLLPGEYVDGEGDEDDNELE